ncbi:MAG TPA: GGDEF domain-containing protein [Burkholderiales bacterium]
MAALEESLGSAIRAKGAERREQRLRGEWVLAAAISYAVDVSFLVAFAGLGTVPARVAIGYALAAAVISALFYLLAQSGRNLKLRDPNMVAAQALVGVAMQLAVVWAAPQIFFPFVANLFTVFAFAMVWMPVRESIAVWLAGSAGVAAVLYAVSGQIGVPHASAAETLVVWLHLSAVLGRCVFVSVHAAGMRTRLAESRAKLARSLEQIEQLVSRDELTKALNRRSLIARLDEERRRVARTGERFCVVLFDVDHFKQVNDRYGHAAGDEVLRRFTAIVHATIRDTDIFGRYGGEEFMLLLPATPPEAALGAVERVHHALRAADWSGIAPDVSVTVSAGIAEYRAAEPAAELLRRADEALYRAKSEGRDRTRLA